MSISAEIDSMTEEQAEAFVSALSAKARACANAKGFKESDAKWRASSMQLAEAFRCDVCGMWHVTIRR